MAKLRVFVSHRTVEAKFADLLRVRLSRDFIGIVKFFISTDVTSVPAGSQWYAQVISELQGADMLLALCSNEAVGQPWINYEAGGACARGVDLIPLCYGGMTPDHLPVPLAMSEGVMLTEERGLQKLYERIREKIGCDMPDADFSGLADEFRNLEREYERQLAAETAASRRQNGDSIVQDPHVLCVSSRQYLDLGLANELQTVLDHFPKNLQHEIVTTSKELFGILGPQVVDVVHIAAYVCPRTGRMYFSEVEMPSGRSLVDPPDFVEARALAMRLKSAKTRLVVIASGDSLALATELLDCTNVISPHGIFSAGALSNWMTTFYVSIKTSTIAEACDLATAQSRVPMKLLTQQVPTDIQLEFQRENASRQDASAAI
jgi:hypothetical protein